MSANPHANGGLLLRDLRLPDFRDYAVEVTAPGAVFTLNLLTRVMGRFLRDVMKIKYGRAELPPFRSRREQLEPLAGCARGDQSRLARGAHISGTTISRRMGGSWRC